MHPILGGDGTTNDSLVLPREGLAEEELDLALLLVEADGVVAQLERDEQALVLRDASEKAVDPALVAVLHGLLERIAEPGLDHRESVLDLLEVVRDGPVHGPDLSPSKEGVES